ncbi:MAG TPA: hypothetical protein VGD89_11680 [Flavipsychrobacter sp.]
MRTFLCFILLFPLLAAYAQRNELGFGGGFFQPATFTTKNALYTPRRGGMGYLIYDHNFGRRQRHFFISAGVRTEMFVFKEADAKYKDRVNHVWPLIAVPVGLNYRSHTAGNTLRLGAAIGPLVSMFPGINGAGPGIGGLSEAHIGYTINKTTLSVRATRPLVAITSTETGNAYKGASLSLDAKFDLSAHAKAAPKRMPDSVLIARRKRNPKAEIGAAYGVFVPFNHLPYSKRTVFPEKGTMAMLIAEGILDNKARGFHITFGGSLQGVWNADMHLLSMGGRLGAGYSYTVGKHKLRLGVQAGPVVTVSRWHVENAGWIQTDAYANVLLGGRASLGARYAFPLSRMAGSVQTENGRLWADYNLQGIMLECKWRVSRK